MTAKHQDGPVDQLKRKRRKVIRGRVHARAPIAARLVLDSHLRGDVGVLSDDLAKDLFSGLDRVGELHRNAVGRAKLIQRMPA
jgi:hypothetical protein